MIYEQKTTGIAFLELNEEKLERCRFKISPTSVLIKQIKKFLKANAFGYIKPTIYIYINVYFFIIFYASDFLILLFFITFYSFIKTFFCKMNLLQKELAKLLAVISFFNLGLTINILFLFTLCHISSVSAPPHVCILNFSKMISFLF